MRRASLISLECVLLLVCALKLQAFHVSIRQMPGVENSVYTGAEIEANGEKLSLMIPSGWRAGNSPQPDSFTLQPRSGGGPLTIQCWPQDAATVLSSATALRQTVAPLLPAATVNGEFPAYSGYGAGRGVDLSFAVQGHSMQARLVVIPLTQGFVSFVLACPAEESATALQSFGVILTSFQRFNPALPPNRPGQFAAAPPEKPKAALAEPTQVFDVLHTEPSVAEDSQAIAAPISIFDGKEDYIRFGLVFVLYSIFMKSMFARHKREAEIRLLCGGYLSDGTEVARFTMPELFAPAPVMDLRTGPLPEEIDPVAAGVKPRAQMAEFFAQAPEHLAKIHSALSALKEVESSGIVEDRQPALLKLHALVCELRDQATVWELRPAWQISSALELLLKRVADKPKDFTPSIVRTVAAAVDVLRDVCVPGIRTNLLMDPPPRILAVDDDALCRRALQFAFEKANLIPDLAESGERAVELANAHTYDVVFMDIQMPGIGGLVACNNIHGTNKNSDVPVIFVTVQSDFNTRAESRLMGGVDLMAKPFLIFELTVRAVTFAARSRLQPPKPVVIELAGAASAADQPRPVTHAVPVSAPAVLVETSAPAWPAPTIAPAAPRPIKVAEWREDSPGTTPGYHAETRRVFDELRATTDPASVMELTGLLYLRIHSAASQAADAKQSVTTRLCTALEGLLKRLYRNPKLASPSVLNTVSNALDLLENLCQPGIEAKLARSSPVRLLVVDDEPLARRAVVGALQLAFDHPESADDGNGAAALIAQKRYDVIFTDVQMPGMDGFELCAAVRGSARNEHTPVIFITSQNDPEAQARATASGGNDFIGKPFLPVEITVKALTFAWEARLAEILCAPTTEEGFNSVAEEESAEALLSA